MIACKPFIMEPDIDMKVDKIIHAAVDAYFQGDINKAELISRELLDNGYHDPVIYCLLSFIALDIGEKGFAKQYACNSLEAASLPAFKNGHPVNRLIKQALSANNKMEHSNYNCPEPRESKKFLLIKAWGFGLFADVDHVLGQLLISELTGRIPVLHWGDNSLYKTDKRDNTFDAYFEPISPYSIDDLAKPEYSFYPPKWKHDNLRAREVNKWSGPFSALPGTLTLNRPEKVVVSDFHTAVNNLIPWIKEGHPLYGLNRRELYRYLIQKYFSLKPDIKVEIEKFYHENMAEKKPILGVHIRGGNKSDEDEEILNINNAYHEYIKQYLENYPQSSIFLLTNDNRIKESFLERYRDRIICTNCVRTNNNLDAHYHEGYDRYQLGLDVIRDTFLALKCNHFIGYAWSNVSCMVNILKEWEPGDCIMLGDNILEERMFFDRSILMFMPMKLFIKTI